MVLVSHFSWPILVKLDLILTNHPWKSTECSKTVYLYLERRTYNCAIIATTISSGWQSGWKMCEVDLNSSWYLECNGLRQRSSHHIGIMQKLFTVHQYVPFQPEVAVCGQGKNWKDKVNHFNSIVPFYNVWTLNFPTRLFYCPQSLNQQTVKSRNRQIKVLRIDQQ